MLDVLLLGMPGVVEGKMFGYAAYYTKGKLFACVYGDGAGVKVPEDVASALLKEDYIIPFQPFGRKKNARVDSNQPRRATGLPAGR